MVTFAKAKKEDTTAVKPLELLVAVDPVKLTATVKKAKAVKTPEKKKGGGPIKVGVRIKFDNGMTIRPPMTDGRVVEETGDGLSLFYSYQHDSWSMTLPRTPEYKAGRINTDSDHKVIWNKSNKTTGLKFEELRMLMPLALQGVNQAEAEHEAKKLRKAA